MQRCHFIVIQNYMKKNEIQKLRFDFMIALRCPAFTRLYGQRIDLLLQSVEEARRMGAVHLGVVELERDRKRSLQPTAPAFAPNHERIVEYAAVHAYGTIDLILRQRRSADNHAVGQIVVRTRFGHLPCKSQIVVVEPLQIVRKGNVA